MPVDCIPFRDTNYFSSLICDYLDENQDLKELYHRFPKIENFKSQIEEKAAVFSDDTRATLVSALKEQYQEVSASEVTHNNIESLKNSNVFTITTGHQLNLFTGPLYFLYKIISTINLTEELKKAYPDNGFVPIYWMATEDHDFEEINFFNFKGKKVQWTKEVSGAVGRLATQDLKEVFEAFAAQLPLGKHAEDIKELFKTAYLKHDTLAKATRYIANALFGTYGLVVVDADHKELKHIFSPYVQKELTEQVSFRSVQETNKQIEGLGLKTQVNPREINLFYLQENLRERIVLDENENTFQVNNTDISWTQAEILNELQKYPERFSPNVIMRPLYQEVILPNLCYIGGGGELAYWFQLKRYFNVVEVPFPILLLRNSVLINTEKQNEKLKKLGLSVNELFTKQNTLINKQVKERSQIEIDLSSQKEHLKTQFKDLYTIAEKTDKSFIGAVAAQERKQIKGLENLEKRLLKAEKRKLQEHILQITDIQDQLFPNQSLQERHQNFSEFYLEYGGQLIPQLVLNLQPLKGAFLILNL